MYTNMTQKQLSVFVCVHQTGTSVPLPTSGNITPLTPQNRKLFKQKQTSLAKEYIEESFLAFLNEPGIGAKWMQACGRDDLKCKLIGLGADTLALAVILLVGSLLTHHHL